MKQGDNQVGRLRLESERKLEKQRAKRLLEKTKEAHLIHNLGKTRKLVRVDERTVKEVWV